jgi:hypothetical protein
VRHPVVQFTGDVRSLLVQGPPRGGRVLGAYATDPVPGPYRVPDDSDQDQRERGHEPRQPPLGTCLEHGPRAVAGALLPAGWAAATRTATALRTE